MSTLKRTKDFAIVPGTPGTPGTPGRWEYVPDPPPLNNVFTPAIGATGQTFPLFQGEGQIVANITSYNGTIGNFVMFIPSDKTKPVQVVRV